MFYLFAGNNRDYVNYLFADILYKRRINIFGTPCILFSLIVFQLMYWVSFIKTCHDPAEKLTPMIQLVATHIDLFKDVQNGKSNSVSLQCAEIYNFKLSLFVHK